MDWSTFSPDILLLIMKHLDHKSLVNCLSVCKFWRDLVDYHIGIIGIWRKVAEEALYNKGIAFKQRSLLPWRELYFNHQLWINGNIRLKVDNILEMDLFKHMHLFEDNLIVIQKYGMKQYKVDTFVQSLEEQSVADYQETCCVSGKLVNGNILYLNVGNRQNRKFSTSLSCCSFILVEDRCFIIDPKNVLSLIKLDTDDVIHITTLMRCYDYSGAICCINIYIDEVYVLKRNGCIIRGDLWHFIDTIIGKINSPHFYNDPSVMCLFLKHSIIYSERSEDGSKTMDVSKIEDTGEIVVRCSGLSCATPYGDILFLGYEDGEVRVYLAKYLLCKKDPLFKFNIKDVDANCTFEDTAVKAIEVYGAKESHYLFIATQHKIIKAIITHSA